MSEQEPPIPQTFANIEFTRDKLRQAPPPSPPRPDLFRSRSATPTPVFLVSRPSPVTQTARIARKSMQLRINILPRDIVKARFFPGKVIRLWENVAEVHVVRACVEGRFGRSEEVMVMYRVDGCRGKWRCIRGGCHVWKVKVSIPNPTLKYSTLFLTLLLTWCELDFSFSTFVRRHHLSLS
jgi:hypothetical protein